MPSAAGLALLLHFWGDYVLQSDWMAQQKTTQSLPALAHALVYTAAFLPLVLWLRLPHAWGALAVIGGSHYVIDRWRLARYLCYAKNFLAPRSAWPKPWKECSATGYNPDRPPWLAVWLLIIADNTLHVTINTVALWWAQFA